MVMKSLHQFRADGQPPDYVRHYIHTALSSDEPLLEPDKTRANGRLEALISLCAAHRLGGKAAAQVSWQAIMRVRPEYVEYDPNRLPKLIHADELKSLSAPMYLLTYYPIYQFGFNVLVGASGSGKSFVALDIAGRIAQERAVVYIAGEGLHGYAARWEAWKDFNKRPESELYFYTEALQVMEEQQLAEFIGVVADHQPILVIIDTLARSAIGVEENSAKEIGAFVGACDALRNAIHTSILVVHHTGKSGEMRGSSALYGAADSVLTVNKTDGTVMISNDPDAGGKNKHAPAAANMYFKIMPHAVGDFAGAVLVETQQMIISAEDPLTNNQELILECIQGYGSGVDAQTVLNTTNLRQSTLYLNLKKLVSLGYLDFTNGLYSLTDMGIDEIGIPTPIPMKQIPF
jgi:hypothetical protein